MTSKSSAKPKEAALMLPTTDFVIQDDQIPGTIPGVISLIQDMMQEVRKTSLVYVWNIGKVIKKVQDDEGRYGSKAVETVAEALGQTPRLFWEMLRFHNYHEDFDKVKGMAIEWSAAREIMRLPDPKQREKLEEEAEKENLTVRDVREKVNKAKSDTSPKTPKIPAKDKGPNALTYFIGLISDLEKINRDLDTRLKDLSGILNMVGNEELTPDEDYNIIVEGDGKKDPLAVQASKQGAIIVKKLNKLVVPLKDTFNEPGQDSEPDGSEEEE
jgi:hypothetical protein